MEKTLPIFNLYNIILAVNPFTQLADGGGKGGKVDRKAKFVAPGLAQQSRMGIQCCLLQVGIQCCHTGTFYVRYNFFSYDLARPSDRGGRIFKTPYFH